MIDINLQLLSIFAMVTFLCAVLMHIVRRNSSLVLTYGLQSFAIALMLLTIGLQEASTSLILISVITFTVKVIIAPIFFNKLISKKQLLTTSTTYLNTPLTLAVILGLTILVKSSIFAPIVSLISHDSQLTILSLSGILISLFLVINRRGVFSQLIGILSFENCLVAFSIIAGIEQTLAIEIGILFDILLWILISGVLVNLIYRHFGSLDTKEMNKLLD